MLMVLACRRHTMHAHGQIVSIGMVIRVVRVSSFRHHLMVMLCTGIGAFRPDENLKQRNYGKDDAVHGKTNLKPEIGHK